MYISNLEQPRDVIVVGQYALVVAGTHRGNTPRQVRGIMSMDERIDDSDTRTETA